MVDATFMCMFVLFFILFKVYSNRKKPKQWTTNTIPGTDVKYLFV